MNKKLLSYAIDFVSFLVEHLGKKKIERVILFGSVAREEAGDDSDVDLFVETIGNPIEKEIETLKKSFFDSMKVKKYWTLKGIRNDIKILSGKLNDWKELKNSIISNGILLYGKYESMPHNVVHQTILSWEGITPESKRVLLHKRLFGYTAGKKEYGGLIQKYGGEKLSKGSLIVPSQHSLVFTQLFRSMKITVRIRKIISYQ